MLRRGSVPWAFSMAPSLSPNVSPPNAKWRAGDPEHGWRQRGTACPFPWTLVAPQSPHHFQAIGARTVERAGGAVWRLGCCPAGRC